MNDQWNILETKLLDVLKAAEPLSEAQFDALALEIFHFQLENNEVYRGYCQGLGRTSPETWQEIPALPTTAFKRTTVRSFPAGQMSSYFQTSGTTEAQSGRHYFRTLKLYEAALVPVFRDWLLPDRASMRMLFLTPPPEQAQHSSLTHMMHCVRQAFGTESSRYYWDQGRLQSEQLLEALLDCQERLEPVFLLGTAFAFAYLMEEMARRNLKLRLAPQSRIMETGGFKGRTREISRQEFYQALTSCTGVAPTHIVNEYGMTELSSQFYDSSLRENTTSSRKAGPGWARVQVVEPLGGKALVEEVGVIRIWDLANLGSVIALQTQDMGVFHGDGRFEILGRVPTASVRGCSLSSETLWQTR